MRVAFLIAVCLIALAAVGSAWAKNPSHGHFKPNPLNCCAVSALT